MTFLCQTYQSTFDSPFNPTARDKQTLKELLSQFPVDSVKATIAQALKDRRAGTIDRFSIGLVRYRLNNPQSTSQPTKDDEEWDLLWRQGYLNTAKNHGLKTWQEGKAIMDKACQEIYESQRREREQEEKEREEEKQALLAAEKAHEQYLKEKRLIEQERE